MSQNQIRRLRHGDFRLRVDLRSYGKLNPLHWAQVNNPGLVLGKYLRTTFASEIPSGTLCYELRLTESTSGEFSGEQLSE